MFSRELVLYLYVKGLTYVIDLWWMFSDIVTLYHLPRKGWFLITLSIRYFNLDFLTLQPLKYVYDSMVEKTLFFMMHFSFLTTVMVHYVFIL